MEHLSKTAIKLYSQFAVAVWWATPVEIASALARLHRMKTLTSSDLAVAQKVADSLALNWWSVPASALILKRAVTSVSQFGLRAADALQLAAALDWCDDQPTGRVLLTADDKLKEAAHRLGFDTSHL